MRFIFLVIVITFSFPCLSSSKLLKSDFSESSFSVNDDMSEDQWLFAAELGLTMTSGNTETQTLLGKINGGFSYLKGKLTYFASFYQKSVGDEKSADRWRAGLKHNIYFNKYNSSFMIAEYSRNNFSSTKNTATVAAGYTQRLYDNHILQWDADVGPGYVWSDYEIETATKKIVHLGSKLKFKITEEAEFEQFLIADIDVNSSNQNVYRSETSLSASIVENFKMKLSYAMKFDNVIEEDKEKLDTETSMSLVYIF